MAESSNFTHLVPGFDFLEGLAKSASAALPAIGQWMTPTLDPAELEKRISELRTVQFWLEQNAALLGTTIQTLEVQRLTLSTLRTMNVQMDDLRDAMQIRTPAAAPAESDAQTGTPEASAAPGAPEMINPMQWWAALTQQFSQLAATAMQEAVARSVAASMVQPSQTAANDTMQPAGAKSAEGARPAAPHDSKPAKKRSAPRKRPTPR